MSGIEPTATNVTAPMKLKYEKYQQVKIIATIHINKTDKFFRMHWNVCSPNHYCCSHIFSAFYTYIQSMFHCFDASRSSFPLIWFIWWWFEPVSSVQLLQYNSLPVATARCEQRIARISIKFSSFFMHFICTCYPERKKNKWLLICGQVVWNIERISMARQKTRSVNRWK